MEDPIILMVVGRIVERGLIATGGILALWFGFRLFAIVSTENAKAELEGAGFTFKAERIGPGIFFALFGAILLGYSLFSQVRITSDIDLTKAAEKRHEESPTAEGAGQQRLTIAGFGEIREGEIPASLKAVNTLISIAERQGKGSTDIAGVDYRRFINSVPALQEFQRAYIDARFDPGVFDSTVAMQQQCATNTPNCQAYLRDRSNADRFTAVIDIIATTLE